MKNTAAKKYIRQVKRLYRGKRRFKRQFIQELKDALLCYLEEHPEATYTDLTKEFGHPSEIRDQLSAVATYDLQPEMSAPEVSKRLNEAIASDKYDVIVINFANPDMVGHTGVIPAAVKAVEAVDQCVGTAVEAIKKADGVLFICADHGNAEKMIDYETGEPHTAHTTNPVPFVLVNYDEAYTLREGGRLADIAPTLLEIMGLPQPAEMTGESLLLKK